MTLTSGIMAAVCIGGERALAGIVFEFGARDGFNKSELRERTRKVQSWRPVKRIICSLRRHNFRQTQMVASELET